MPIDTKYIDVDFESDPHETGLLEQTDEQVMASMPMQSFEDEYPHLMIPRAKRKDLALARRDSFRRSTRKIYSQGKTSACVGFGTAQAFETTFVRRYGRKNHISFSGMDIYNHIAIRGSLMAGAYIADGMSRLVNHGVLPMTTTANTTRFNHTVERLGWKQKPRGAGKTREQFIATKWAKAQGFDEIESALLSGFCGIWGRSRHCVPPCYLDYRGNDPVAAFPNSWSASWGDEGWGYDSKRVYSKLTLYLILEIQVPDIIEDMIP